MIKKTRIRRREKLPQFGSNLVKARNAIEKKQVELSQEFSLSVNTISRMERNKGDLMTYYLYCLFQFYQVSPIFLFSGKGEILLPSFIKTKEGRRKENSDKKLEKEKLPLMGSYLRKVRNQLKKSQPKIVQEFGISHNSLSRMENDHDVATLYYIYKLYQTYQANPVYLISGKGEFFLKL